MLSMITNIYNKKTKGPTLMELFTGTRKLKVFLTTRDVRCVHQRLHSTHRYDIQVLATHATALVVIKKKNFFSFPVAVSNFIKVGPLVFLL